MAEIDRGTWESRGRREPKLLKVVMVALIVAVLFASSLSLLSNPSPEIPPAPVPAGIAYTSHATIYIDGNSQFTNASGVVWGSGTVADPYIIEGWDISASSAHGIRIQNTNAYFIVRDCYVHDSGPSYYGISLHTVNGIVSNNTCWNNEYGIALDSSSDNNTLSNNTCSDNTIIGIYLDSSSNNTLIDNTCSNNYDGIYLDSSSNNTLSNNNCSNNWAGIALDSSSNNNALSNNTCSDNTVIGISLGYSSNNNTLSNNNFSNNQYGIILGYSSNNNTLISNNCSSNSGMGIFLYESSNNNTLISNNCSSNVLEGIELGSSSNNTLSNNTCNLNIQYGIRLWSSSDNKISWNQVCNNTLRGVDIVSGSNNTIWNNTFIGNNGGGGQAEDDGTNNWWNTSGTPHGYGNYWNDLTTPDINDDGIVDDPFDYVIGGSAGAKDYYPLTTPSIPPSIPEFSDLVVPIVGLMLILLIFDRARKKL
jgi:parallel beta-helix repeat protein